MCPEPLKEAIQAQYDHPEVIDCVESKLKRTVSIVFEGVDSSGKSTCISLLKKHIESMGYVVEVMHNPQFSIEEMRNTLIEQGSMEDREGFSKYWSNKLRDSIINRILDDYSCFVKKNRHADFLLIDRFIQSSYIYNGDMGDNASDFKHVSDNLKENVVKPVLSFYLGTNYVFGRDNSIMDDLDKLYQEYEYDLKSRYLRLAMVSGDSFSRSTHITHSADPYSEVLSRMKQVFPCLRENKDCYVPSVHEIYI